MKRKEIRLPNSGTYVLCFQRPDEKPLADLAFFDGDRSLREVEDMIYALLDAAEWMRKNSK